MTLEPEAALSLMAEHVKLIADLWLVPGNQDVALVHLQETKRLLVWAQQDAQPHARNDKRPNTHRAPSP